MRLSKGKIVGASVAAVYIAALLLGEFKSGLSFFQDEATVLDVSDSSSRCVVENVVVGDGMVRAASHCEQPEHDAKNN